MKYRPIKYLSSRRYFPANSFHSILFPRMTMIAKHISSTALLLLSLLSSFWAFQQPASAPPGRRTPCSREPWTTTGLGGSNQDGNNQPRQTQLNRRDFLQSTVVVSTSLVAMGGMLTTLGPQSSSMANAATTATDFDASSFKVLVLGGTGFVGSRVVKKLKSMGIQVIATSRDGRDGTVAFDVTAPAGGSSSSSVNVTKAVQDLAKDCTAVISTIGVIGTTQDMMVNSATGLAAVGAKAAGVTRFVYISVAPEVKQVAKDIDFLKPYMQGKTFSQDAVTSIFGATRGPGGDAYYYTLIEPTFIYGGESFNVNPPRVAGFYGGFVEAILSSGPLRAITNLAPEGFLKIALEPPVSVDSVANAAVAGALGRTAATPVLDMHDKIVAAAKLV